MVPVRELSGDSAEIREHLSARDEQALKDDDKVSPQFDRVKQALKEIGNIKDKKEGESSSDDFLIGAELEKFEGVLKKVQNHRDIVKTYHYKLEELGSHSSSSPSQESVPEPQKQVIFVQGKRTTIDRIAPPSGGISGMLSSNKAEVQKMPHD